MFGGGEVFFWAEGLGGLGSSINPGAGGASVGMGAGGSWSPCFGVFGAADIGGFAVPSGRKAAMWGALPEIDWAAENNSCARSSPL